jgi:chemotaxis protein MotB
MNEQWLIPYADLLTLLLALFIVLFASSQIDEKKFEQLSRSLNMAFHGGHGVFMPSNIVPISQDGRDRNDGEEREPSEADERTVAERFEEETRNLQELQQKIDQYIEVNGLSTQLNTNLNYDELKITIKDTALFDSGSAEVRPEARRIAEAISAMLVEFPDYEIVVSGHTDDRPINTAQFPDNWALSAHRALNFMRILLNNSGLDPARFSSVGYGEYRPVASNDTPEGRAQNRRVEVSVLRNFTLEDVQLEVNVPNTSQ